MVGGTLSSSLVSWYSAYSGVWDLLLVAFGCFAPGPHLSKEKREKRRESS